MPFGVIFGALFFGGVCSWFGLRVMGEAGAPAKLAGGSILVLGPALALALWQRWRWARSAGVIGAVAIMVAAIDWSPAGAGGAVLAVPLCAVLAATLLLLPVTGRPTSGTAAASPGSGAGRWPGWAAVAAFAGLALAAAWDRVAPPVAPLAVAPALPASSIARSVKWSDFGTALERARAEGKPILATFVTAWCPYCTKMREVWRDGRVVERLQDVLTVRVDAEDTRPVNGHAGAELARRYEVMGFPVQVLLDASGRILGRADGYQSADQLLDWLDSTLGASARAVPRPAAGGSGVVPVPPQEMR